MPYDQTMVAIRADADGNPIGLTKVHDEEFDYGLGVWYRRCDDCGVTKYYVIQVRPGLSSVFLNRVSVDEQESIWQARVAEAAIAAYMEIP